MRPVDAAPHDGLGLEVLQRLVGVAIAVKLAIVVPAAASLAVRPAQRLGPAMGSPGGQGRVAVLALVEARKGRAVGGVQLLAAVAHHVLVGVAVVLVRLSLAARGTKEALLALAAAAHARRVVRVVDAAQVAAHLAATARDARLVDALVLGNLGL